MLKVGKDVKALEQQTLHMQTTINIFENLQYAHYEIMKFIVKINSNQRNVLVNVLKIKPDIELARSTIHGLIGSTG